MSAGIAKFWTFASSSTDKTYQTILYTDGSTSCDCFGWCRRVKGDGSRSCKHTRSVDMKMADRECVSAGAPGAPGIRTEEHREHRQPAKQPEQQAEKPVFGQLGKRRLNNIR